MRRATENFPLPEERKSWTSNAIPLSGDRSIPSVLRFDSQITLNFRLLSILDDQLGEVYFPQSKVIHSPRFKVRQFGSERIRMVRKMAGSVRKSQLESRKIKKGQK
jgi:hypothetical protein